MRVLVACEFSGVVREAFAKRGHDAWSCDLLPTEIPGQHIQGDVIDLLNNDLNWDLMIAHPPCTHLAISGARWFKDKQEEQKQALEFVRLLMDAPIKKIAIENPISVISSKIRKPDQIIQPYQFGHGAMKSTCLWLKNLPKLIPTNIVDREYIILKNGKQYPKWSYDTFCLSKDKRAKERSKTFPGIAEAMASQWSDL